MKTLFEVSSVVYFFLPFFLLPSVHVPCQIDRMPALVRVDCEESMNTRPLPHPPPTSIEFTSFLQARAGQGTRVAGALIRTFDDDDCEQRENDEKELREESEELIESTRAMFSTLLDGHSTIMQGHTAIESEALDLNRRQEELKNNAQELQTRIDELEEELRTGHA